MLNNIKVLELASVLAGPSAGQFFAELGAEVIKVENIKTSGDVTRSWKGTKETKDSDLSAYFCSCNWGKKSIALDLNLPSDKMLVHKLIAKSDIIIASYKPGDGDKLGVGYEQAKSINPQIIYGQITGYGSDNDRVGYDAVIQAESGFMDLNGEKDGDPLKMPVALIDVLAAHHLKEGLLLGLLKRERTGEGSFIEVSLIQAAISSLANQASNWLVAKNLPRRQGSLHPNIAPYGETFKTKDGVRIILAIGSDRQFQDLLNILNLGYLISDSRFYTNQSRVLHRNELKNLFDTAISNFYSNELILAINRMKIPAGKIQNVEEVFQMKEARDLLISQNGLNGLRNFVSRSSGNWFDSGGILPPPHLGEHTHEIISSLE
jgi:crotonobetainyl-CoA:carnitine CoA-transferase CaiB-like acyl-CoA transferase